MIHRQGNTVVPHAHGLMLHCYGVYQASILKMQGRDEGWMMSRGKSDLLQRFCSLCHCECPTLQPVCEHLESSLRGQHPLQPSLIHSQII